ncbi:MAG TPA: hypothetical protein VF494_12885 [Candidatus Limnocylindrales bacterium]
MVGLDMAHLLGPSDPEVRAAIDRSREILARLEARPFLARLDATVARSTRDGDPRDARERSTNGLTTTF